MMFSHPEAATMLVGDLSKVPGIERIVLYGSVAKGVWNAESDVDIACILDDTQRSFALGLDDAPWGVRFDIDAIADAFRERTGIKAHVVTYYDAEYLQGIKLQSTREPEPLLLHGKVVFERYSNE